MEGGKLKNTSIGMFRIAGAYIGTVVGAGFSSGQEILRFFTSHGEMGLWGIAVATSLFFFFGYTALLLGKRLNARSHLEVVRFTNGKLLGGAIDIIITVFLFGGFGVMIAGAGAVFREQFGAAPAWGMLVMASISVLTVMTGTKGVVNAISAVVPLLIAMLFLIFVTNVSENPLTPEELEASEAVASATPDWFLSAVNYASYNLVIAIAVLAPLGANAKSKKSLLGGALLGAAGLGLGIAAINFCLMTNITGVAALEVPMIAVAESVSAPVRMLFAAVIFSEIYSTAIGDLYGFSQRMPFSLPKKLMITLAAAGAFSAGQLGFSNLVRFLYPAVGYGALLFFAGAIYAWIRKRDMFT
jgi:uncharacterized membrane protein YkvI